MTINITQACVYLYQNLLIYHKNAMKPQLRLSVISGVATLEPTGPLAPPSATASLPSVFKLIT